MVGVRRDAHLMHGCALVRHAHCLCFELHNMCIELYASSHGAYTSSVQLVHPYGPGIAGARACFVRVCVSHVHHMSATGAVRAER